MQPVEPQREHLWLKQLVGDWTYESECVMGPDQPPARHAGSERVRALGDLWVICEGGGEVPGGGTATNMFTFGFDPAKGRFVGTFIASVMSQLWTYEGRLDATGKVLTLDTEGPSFCAEGKTARYQDVIEIKSPDHRVLTSRTLGDDGTWTQFMTAHYRRKP
jgi:hypothetical protein